MKSKICNKCYKSYELSEKYFRKRKSSRDGFRNECKKCLKEFGKKYYAKNRLEIRSKQNKKYEEDEDFRKRSNLKNREYHKKNSKQLYKKRKNYLENWAKENRDRRNRYAREYKKRNPSKVNAGNYKRKCQKIAAIPKWADLKKIEIIYEKAKWLGSITGLKYHVDHVIPLNSDKVCGLHVWENLQILEASENVKKSNKL